MMLTPRRLGALAAAQVGAFAIVVILGTLGVAHTGSANNVKPTTHAPAVSRTVTRTPASRPATSSPAPAVTGSATATAPHAGGTGPGSPGTGSRTVRQAASSSPGPVGHS
jgi:hypothetical protein